MIIAASFQHGDGHVRSGGHSQIPLTIHSDKYHSWEWSGRLGVGQGFPSCGKWKLEQGLGREGDGSLGGSHGSETLVLSAKVAWRCPQR